jgi:hypothetical protein
MECELCRFKISKTTDVFSLSDQLASVELGNHALQDLIHDRREHTLVIVQTQFAVDGRKLLDARP